MTRHFLAAAAALVAASFAPASAAQEFRIGFLNTLSGGAAIIGNEQMKGWKLGLEHEGWTKDGDKLGGVPTRIFYGDDQRKPDVGLQAVREMLDRQQVDLVAGTIWSNVLLATVGPVTSRDVPYVGTNAGASPMAGAMCNPLFTSTSWNNDQVPEAMAKRMNDDQIKTIYFLSPNYQAGKDMVAGALRTLKGPKVVGEDYYRLGESDFQPNISKVRAANPEAVFVFAPGSMGISFAKQWARSGLQDRIKLYSVFTVDWLTLPAIGDGALGSYSTMYWNADLDIPANKRFVADFRAKHGRTPSHYAAQAYDAARLIAAALRATGGKFEDGRAFSKALRHTKYDSARGPYNYNVNGMPIQNFYLRDVVKGEDGKPVIRTAGVIVADDKDSYWQKCPEAKRL
jgi:branched-chain amino acid transport system substrate-binding protein